MFLCSEIYVEHVNSSFKKRESVLSWGAGEVVGWWVGEREHVNSIGDIILLALLNRCCKIIVSMAKEFDM